MKTPHDIANWMLQKLTQDESLYREDVISFLETNKLNSFLHENENGNLVIAPTVLKAFKKITSDSVVWVRGESYWRFKINSDGVGRISQ